LTQGAGRAILPAPEVLMRILSLLFILLLSGCLSGAPPADLASMLAGHTMEFEPSEGSDAPPDRQSWNADGSTIFHTYGLGRYPRPGVWRIEGRRYCSDFGDPGVTRSWTCYRVKVLEEGAVMEFTEIEESWQIIQFTQFWRGRFVN
jgi:hypothetical protein